MSLTHQEPGPAPASKEPGEPDALVALAAELRLSVTRLARVLRQRAETGATPSMLSALYSLELRGPMTLGQLAAAEQVQPPTMTAIVARLEAARLVTREPDLEDRRISHVRLSPEGKRLLERSRSRKTAYLARRLRTLDAAEREALRAAVPLLRRLLDEDA